MGGGKEDHSVVPNPKPAAHPPSWNESAHLGLRGLQQEGEVLPGKSNREGNPEVEPSLARVAWQAISNLKRHPGSIIFYCGILGRGVLPVPISYSPKKKSKAVTKKVPKENPDARPLGECPTQALGVSRVPGIPVKRSICKGGQGTDVYFGF